MPVALAATAGAALAWIPARTRDFARLVEAAVDVHRGRLYEALRWPPPDDPAAERAAGRLLTEYLVRGLDGTEPKFTPR